MPDCLPFMRRLRRFYLTLLGSGLLLLSHHSAARFESQGFELVYTAPVETHLQNDDLRDSADVWRQLFAQAKRQIDITQFYVASQPGGRLEGVLAQLRAAGERGVKIRFLLEEKGVRISTPETLEQLKTIPNLQLRIIPYQQLSGGIIHAKYLLIDGQQAFVGSQNFDWRALEHIQETGLLISDSAVVSQIQAIFNQDWQAQALLAAQQPVPELDYQPVLPPAPNYLIASPRAWNPAGVIDSQEELPRLLAAAKQRVRIQVMDYTPLSYGAEKSRPYYPLIDNALRSAAARGVKVELMVADWNIKKPAVDYLKSLAMLPNIAIKVVTIPQASQGFIPFARVVHSKIMTIDGELAWVGTSNWSGGYFDNSRNLELVMRNPRMAARLEKLWLQLWDSEYAAPLDLTASPGAE